MIIGGNGVVIVKSEEEFNSAMSKAEGNKHIMPRVTCIAYLLHISSSCLCLSVFFLSGGSSPSVFYFTAAWCGPCMLFVSSET